MGEKKHRQRDSDLVNQKTCFKIFFSRGQQLIVHWSSIIDYLDFHFLHNYPLRFRFLTFLDRESMVPKCRFCCVVFFTFLDFYLVYFIVALHGATF